mmetsp:Transcript_43258/g.115718  ORF Transcript_43258/g.115718 Transcript_43258/m.115718 type:complete len:89 (+) Transcript_43258:224-490(+)
MYIKNASFCASSSCAMSMSGHRFSAVLTLPLTRCWTHLPTGWPVALAGLGRYDQHQQFQDHQQFESMDRNDAYISFAQGSCTHVNLYV